MNYLAHIYLSGPDPELQVGGFLGDFIKGPVPTSLPIKLQTGILLHRRIDTLTDRHPAFVDIRTSLEPPWRRYGGILLDVYFDYLLASQWRGFHHQPLELFCQSFYDALAKNIQDIPPRAQDFCHRAPQIGWLESYADSGKMALILDRIGGRLRKPLALGDAWGELTQRHGAIEDAFRRLMVEHRNLAANFVSEPPKSYL